MCMWAVSLERSRQVFMRKGAKESLRKKERKRVGERERERERERSELAKMEKIETGTKMEKK